jgi:hypothetical protein
MKSQSRNLGTILKASLNLSRCCLAKSVKPTMFIEFPSLQQNTGDKSIQKEERFILAHSLEISVHGSWSVAFVPVMS